MSLPDSHRLEADPAPFSREHQIIRYSPSMIQQFLDCGARFWLTRHADGSRQLPVDRTLANIGSAIHGALMAWQRQLDAPGERLPDTAERVTLLRQLVRRELLKLGLEPTEPTVAERLQQAAPGLVRLAQELPVQQSGWAMDGRRGERLMWIEPRLDHGPACPGVELAPGVVLPTVVLQND